MSGRPFKPDEIDVYIGKLIANWRNKLGLSQKDLAEKCGVTFQQIQKYESAGNRVSASRLYHIADAIGISIVDFYGEVANFHRVYDKKTRQIIESLSRMSDDDKQLALKLFHRLIAK